MTESPVIDPERQKKAKEYGRLKRRLWLIDTAFVGVYSILWLVTGWSAALRNWLLAFTNNEWLIVFWYAAVFGGLAYLLNLPLSYYSGFVLPHRFDQSNQTLSDWVVDQMKGMLIGIPIGLALIEIVYAVLRADPVLWWLWVSLVILFFSVILANLAPVLIMPIFNKFVPLGEEHADLAERLIRLAERAHTNVQGVFKFDMSRRTKSANAALTGLGSTRRIILGDTLINEFTPDEVETVLAHELGHHVNRDIPFLITFSTILTLLGLYLVSLAMGWAAGFFGFTSVADVAAIPALMIFVGLYNLITMPIENGISRWRETMADDYALKSTGKQAAFASAFTRLANQNLGEVDPEKWVVFLFYSHPPLGERIAKARKA